MSNNRQFAFGDDCVDRHECPAMTATIENNVYRLSRPSASGAGPEVLHPDPEAGFKHDQLLREQSGENVKVVDEETAKQAWLNAVDNITPAAAHPFRTVARSLSWLEADDEQ